MKKWIFRDRPDGKPPQEWAEKLGITPLLLHVLWGRGLTAYGQIENYLSGRLANLTPPGAWPQIPHAARMLVDALLERKKLAVWGDYDVDGITATTLVLDVLEEHGFDVGHHLPERMSEGYGLNVDAIGELYHQGYRILLTVDCGISDLEAVTHARELGFTVIVSDHHMPPEILPPATGIVNPRMSQAGEWPSCNLAGVGVAFYLMAAVNSLLAPHTGRRYRMDDALDIVALGTLADVMQLDRENRLLVRAGLKRMAKPERPGMAALKVVSGFDLAAELSSGQTVFRLAPRINAAGRMGHPELALKLLRSRDYHRAMDLAMQLDECNTSRKAEEERIHAEARKQALLLLEQSNYSALVLFGADWHPGIVGIVASRIVEEFNRPAIVLCEDKGYLKGSGRSVADFDLHGALSSTARFLLGFGGHKMAAGVRLDKAHLEDFRHAFSQAARNELGEEPSAPQLMLECELDFAMAMNNAFLQELQLMQPFGPGNAEPVFASPPLIIRGRSLLGRSREHVRLELEDRTTKLRLTAKAWRMAEQFPPEMVGQAIRIAYTPRLDDYRGLPEIDLGIKDWKPDKSAQI